MGHWWLPLMISFSYLVCHSHDETCPHHCNIISVVTWLYTHHTICFCGCTVKPGGRGGNCIAIRFIVRPAIISTCICMWHIHYSLCTCTPNLWLPLPWYRCHKSRPCCHEVCLNPFCGYTKVYTDMLCGISVCVEKKFNHLCVAWLSECLHCLSTMLPVVSLLYYYYYAVLIVLVDYWVWACVCVQCACVCVCGTVYNVCVSEPLPLQAGKKYIFPLPNLYFHVHIPVVSRSAASPMLSARKSTVHSWSVFL